MFRHQLEAERRAHLSHNFYQDPAGGLASNIVYPSQLINNAAVEVPRPRRDYYNIFSEEIALSQLDHNLSPQKG